MIIKKNFSLKRVLAFASIFAIGAVSFTAVKSGFSALAQNGNFANNVRTEIHTLDKNPDKTEKTEYLSGETISMSSRLETTSDGTAESYDRAYLLVKIPKQYLDGDPNFATTSNVRSTIVVADNDYYIRKITYSIAAAGSVNSVNFNFKLKNPQTPKDYSPEVIHEFYAKDGRLLSKQSKTVKTTKAPQEISYFYKNKHNGGATNTTNVAYITTYTDAANTTIDRTKFATMGKLTWRFQGGLGKIQGVDYGKSTVSKITYTDTLPEYMEIAPESLADGWTFDATTRVATKVVDVDPNFSGDPLYDIDNKYGVYLTTVYRQDTPESVLGTTVQNTVTARVEFADGTIKSKDASTQVQMLARRRSRKGPIELSKSSNIVGFDGSKWVTLSNGTIVNTRNLNNIDYGYKDFDTIWNINIKVNNNGDDAPVELEYVADIPRDDNIKIASVHAPSDLFTKYGISKVGIYAIKKDGSEILVANTTNGNRIEIPEDTVSVKFKLPDNESLPSNYQDSESYTLNFTVNTKYKNPEALANSLPLGGLHQTVNEANAKLRDDTIKVESSAYFRNDKSVVTNSIQYNSSIPTISIGQTIRFSTCSPSILDNIFSYYSTKINNLPDNKLVFLYPQGLLLTDQAKNKLATESTKYKYFENYKNTGKSAFIISDARGDDFGTNCSGLFKVGEITPNGSHEIEMITVWNSADKGHTGLQTVTDDLDFNDDGNTTSHNIARSSTNIIVAKPEQVAIKKFIRKTDSGDDFSAIARYLEPGDLVDYSLAVINLSDRVLPSSRVLEILPTIGDKSIVAGNNGVQSNRGSTTSTKMTGPIAEQQGFTISYSTDAPGANQNESWNKNFVPAAQITNWSDVRMVKIEQNPGYNVPSQTIVHFDFKAKIDQNSPDLTVANNTAAVAISSTGNLVESDPVVAKVEYPALVEGVAFEDNNKNSLYEQGTDTLLANYQVELLKGSTVIKTTTTDAQGHYQFSVKEHSGYSVRFIKPADAPADLTPSPTRDNSINMNNGSHFSYVSTRNGVTYDNTRGFAISDRKKSVIRNIGFERPRSSVKAKFETTNGTKIKDDEFVKQNALIGEAYTATKPNEITKDNFVYVFSELKQNSAPETGNVTADEQVITFVYAPKPGGEVKAKFQKENGDTLAQDAVVKPNGTQVGTPYTATKQTELTDANGIVYAFKELKQGSDPETGTVSATVQTVTFIYAPKPGSAVKAKFLDEQNNPISAEVEVKPNNTPVGTDYNHTQPNEITHNNLVYIFKELKQGSAAKAGKVSTTEQVITYIYAPKQGSEVKAKYTLADGTEIKTQKTVKAANTQVGAPYADTPDQEITHGGLTYVYTRLAQNSAPQNGTVTANAQTITYIYAPKQGGSVMANFTDENGNALKASEVVKANGTQVGTPYNHTQPNELTNNNLVYIFKELKQGSAAKAGTVTNTAQTITYVYAPKRGGEVTAKFVDEDDKEIKNSVVVSAQNTQVGTEYISTNDNEITKDNLVYTFKELKQNSAPKNGRVAVDAQTITYIYAPKPGGEVKVKFIDEEDNEIQAEKVVSAQNTQVGTEYDASTLKDDEITKNGLKYIFKERKADSADEQGRVEVDGKEVVYVYEAKKGSQVNIKFLDENGNEIQKSEIVTEKDTQVGTPYEAKYPKTIQIDGKTYRLKQVRKDNGDAPEKGTVTEDEQNVVVLYELVPEIKAPDTGISTTLNILLAVVALSIISGGIYFAIKKA